MREPNFSAAQVERLVYLCENVALHWYFTLPTEVDTGRFDQTMRALRRRGYVAQIDGEWRPTTKAWDWMIVMNVEWPGATVIRSSWDNLRLSPEIAAHALVGTGRIPPDWQQRDQFWDRHGREMAAATGNVRMSIHKGYSTNRGGEAREGSPGAIKAAFIYSAGKAI